MPRPVLNGWALYTTWNESSERAMATNSDRRDTINAIFAKAAGVEKPDRAAFLDKACAGDAALLAEVEKLLREVDETRTLEMADRRGFPTVEAGTLLGGRFRIVRFVGN